MMKKNVLFLILALLMTTTMVVNAKSEVPMEARNGMDLETNIESIIDLRDETPFKEESEGTGIEPLANFLAIDNESIGASGSTWDQPQGYDSYRIYVKNNRNEKMTVTVSYGSKSWKFDVKANDDETYYVNDAVYGRHFVDYKTSSGLISGKVSVRVSNIPF